MHFKNYTFKVVEEVYKPAEDSFLLAEHMNTRVGDHVLDMGTGVGILGIVAASQADEVVAVDISPYAVHCAKENAKLNHMTDKILFVQGNMFAPINREKKFDMILFNAPYLPSEPTETCGWLQKAWNGGSSGRTIIQGFIHTVPLHLKPNGRVFLVISSITGVEETLRNFEKSGMRARIVAEQPLPFFETLFLIEAHVKVA